MTGPVALDTTVDFPEYSTLPEERAVQLLAFAAAHPNPRGHAEEAIRHELGLTPARYHQLLGRLIQTDQAARIDPMTTHRLRRLRAERDAETTRRLNTARTH